VAGRQPAPAIALGSLLGLTAFTTYNWLTAYLAGLSPNEFLFDTLLFAVFSGAVAVPLVPVLVTAIALTGPGLGPSGVLAVGGGLLAAVGYGLTRRAGPRWERKLTTG
jgi:hypothetical protein